MRFRKLFLLSTGIMSSSSLYFLYRYFEVKRFEKEYKFIKDKKQMLFELHNSNNFFQEKNISLNEKMYNIDKLRLEILKFCNGEVLETGVGTSRNLEFYPRNKKINITAVDYSPNVLEEAIYKTNLLGINYELQDNEEMTFKDNSFDTIVDTFSFEYYYNPKKVLNEMKRVLKPNGKILILTTGLSDNYYVNIYKRFITPQYILQKGFYPIRKWDSIIDNFEGLEIKLKKKFHNGSLYFYVLENKK